MTPSIRRLPHDAIDPIRSWDYRGSLHSSNLLDHSGALFVARVIATTEVRRELPALRRERRQSSASSLSGECVDLDQ